MGNVAITNTNDGRSKELTVIIIESLYIRFIEKKHRYTKDGRTPRAQTAGHSHPSTELPPQHNPTESTRQIHLSAPNTYFGPNTQVAEPPNELQGDAQ